MFEEQVLGRRRRRRLHHRRDVLLRPGSPDRDRRHQEAGKVAVITLADAPGPSTREGWSSPRRVQAQSSRRAPTSWASIASAARDDDAASRANPRGDPRAMSPRCRCPIARREAEPTFQSLRDATTAARRAAVPDRARPLHLQPLRDRGLRPRGARDRHPLSRRVLRRRAASHPRARGVPRAARRRRAASPPTCPGTPSSARTRA